MKKADPHCVIIENAGNAGRENALNTF